MMDFADVYESSLNKYKYMKNTNQIGCFKGL